MKLVNTVIIIFDFPAGRFFGAIFAKNSNICKQILENLMFVNTIGKPKLFQGKCVTLQPF